MTKFSNESVVLGLSGGVDSTTAALLLKNKGLNVIGLFFDIQTTNLEGKERAEKAAKELGIKFIYKNVADDFNDKIIGNFVSEYLHGRTPNPCIMCNPLIKFKILEQAADEVGAKYIATGHYANTVFNKETNCTLIKMADNIKKDQSYMLYRLPTTIIERLILPLCEFEDKEDVRNIARANNLSNANLKDSQEICFINKTENYIEYLERTGNKLPKGEFIDKNGNVLGTHEGIHKYTIGQRKGLGITFGKPVFVTKINHLDNTITLGEQEDLFKDTIYSTNNFFQETNSSLLPKSLEGRLVKAKIRYASKPCDATLSTDGGDRLKINFKEKQRAATPGQSVVIYLDNMVVGGGFIE
ncbi:MAG: tRNA 2-thiouridine(34) synthase MnmA [Anaerovoracaceae bacterium]